MDLPNHAMYKTILDIELCLGIKAISPRRPGLAWAISPRRPGLAWAISPRRPGQCVCVCEEREMS